MGIHMRNHRSYTGKVRDTRPSEIGEIKAFMRNSAPRGYLACDGATYNIADYPLLTDMFLTEFGSKNYFGGDGTTTFKVPDLRGEFLRGTGTNGHSGEGSGANVGVHQSATQFPNLLTYKGSASSFLIRQEITNPTSESTFIENKNPDATMSPRTHTVSVSSNAVSAGSNRDSYYTSRPTNTSVLYCIRAY